MCGKLFINTGLVIQILDALPLSCKNLCVDVGVANEGSEMEFGHAVRKSMGQLESFYLCARSISGATTFKKAALPDNSPATLQMTAFEAWHNDSPAFTPYEY